LTAYGVGVDAGIAYGVLLQAAEVATAVALGVPALMSEGVSLRAVASRRALLVRPDPQPSGDS
jgi:phosphatidylinositol alpha-mannosyltransferase